MSRLQRECRRFDPVQVHHIFNIQVMNKTVVVELSVAEVEDIVEALHTIRSVIAEERREAETANRAETLTRREARIHRLIGRLLSL